MRKQAFYRITAFLLLVFLLAPISIQFAHAFEDHNYHHLAPDGHDQIQNTEINCALFHQQINHIAIDITYDFTLNTVQFFNEDLQIIVRETVQNYIKRKSSRAPPVSFV